MQTAKSNVLHDLIRLGDRYTRIIMPHRDPPVAMDVESEHAHREQVYQDAVAESGERWQTGIEYGWTAETFAPTIEDKADRRQFLAFADHIRHRQQREARDMWPVIRVILQDLEMTVSRADGGDDRRNSSLPRHHEKAWQSYEFATRRICENDSTRDDPTDEKIYEWLVEYWRDEDYILPAVESWIRYVKAARKHHDQNKNQKRAGRRGRSIIVKERPASRSGRGASQNGWQICGRPYAGLMIQPRDRADASCSSRSVAFVSPATARSHAVGRELFKGAPRNGMHPSGRTACAKAKDRQLKTRLRKRD